MANEEHLAILKNGVEAWNLWRKENPDVEEPDISGADLRGEPLAAARLDNAILKHAGSTKQFSTPRISKGQTYKRRDSSYVVTWAKKILTRGHCTR